MTKPDLRLVGKASIPDTDPLASFFLIVTDHDQGCFSVEGPMTNDRPWQDAAMHARNHARRIECGPTGSDRNTLAIDYQQAYKLGGVPPGTILRVRQ